MTGQITISIWVFILLVVIAVLAVLDRILIPSTRWFLRRRINRVHRRNRHPAGYRNPAFPADQKTGPHRSAGLRPQSVIEAIQDLCRENDMPLEVVQKKVLNYAREIVPSFNAYLYFRIGYWIAKKIARLLYRVRVGLIETSNMPSSIRIPLLCLS